MKEKINDIRCQKIVSWRYSKCVEISSLQKLKELRMNRFGAKQL